MEDTNLIKKEKKIDKKAIIKEYLLNFIIIGGLAFLILKFVGHGVYIPSESMVPTLEVNDRLIVSNVYKPENLKEGDIVTFKCDEYGDKLLIKRLIGLPGDTIEIKDGVVFRNGKQLEEKYVENNEYYDGSFEIPEGKYLFLGDNRADSDDARYWENPYVDGKDIEGKVQIRIYPFNKIGKVD